jgi:alkaline phosphatase D
VKARGGTEVMTRREAIRKAAAVGAVLAWSPGLLSTPQRTRWLERRDDYPQGVASGDPHPRSVLLWTRRPPSRDGSVDRVVVEVAQDPDFTRVVAQASGIVSPDTDWTCRVLAAGLRPSTEYWFRFTDARGFGSRVGRTRTAPAVDDPRPIRFAFVSCQNVTQGACNAYRRMMFEDAQHSPEHQIEFVLHLGDFVYEVVWYPEDRPNGMYDRRLRDIVRYPTGEQIGDFHVPTTVEDYRTLYRAYLADPDLQDARARWPFVCVWDNHEFSWKGWQAQQSFGSGVRPGQSRKVAANQAWFEYQPARVAQSSRSRVDRFVAPKVADRSIRQFDESGLGLDPDNLAAINSLRIYRTLRWGRHVELLLTDNRSYRSQPVTDHPDFAPFRPEGFPFFLPQDVIEILDAGRAYNRGAPPEAIAFGGGHVRNPRKHAPPQSMLGKRQKSWLLSNLRRSTAAWKIWGNSVAMLNWRTDLQNLPLTGRKWPTDGYGQIGDDDWSAYCTERYEILDLVQREQIAGLVSVAGDRHAFLAGTLSRSLPPDPFLPVAAEFIVGSVSAPGLAEAAEYAIARDHPLRALYFVGDAADSRAESSLNVSIMHGVRSSMRLADTGSRSEALAARNPDVAPHLTFADVGGHGYAVVRADGAAIDVEFVCLSRPLERSGGEDGGPIIYRVVHRVDAWKAPAPPSLRRTGLEGTPPILGFPE